MALKRILTAAEFEALRPELKTEYKPSGDGFTLDLSDYEDPAALKRAKDHEKEARKAAEKKAKDTEDALALLTEERDGLLTRAIPRGDVEKLEASYKTKLAAREAELTKQIEGMRGTLNTMLVDNVATSLAAKISTAPAVMLPHIRARLAAEHAEGKSSTRILDRDGKPSAATIDDLEKEFLANKDFAGILVGSKGSGSGAAGGANGGGAAHKGTKIDWNKSPAEIAAALTAQGFNPGATE